MSIRKQKAGSTRGRKGTAGMGVVIGEGSGGG